MLAISQGSILSTWHIGRWPHSDGRWHLAMEDDKDDKLNKWVFRLDMKTNIACHAQGSIGRWPHSDVRWPLAMEDDKLNKWVLS